jgi:hypothetical protein
MGAARSLRVITDKFAIASIVWNPFTENCNKLYEPLENLATEENLFPTEEKYSCVLYIANKIDTFGIKFCLSVDVKSIYSLIWFPYFGEKEHRPADKLQV